MSKAVKFFSLFSVLLIGFNILFGMGTSVYANEKNSNNIEHLELTPEEQVQAEELAKDLEFYFEKIGHIQEDGTYVVTDIPLLKEKADQGDIHAQNFLNAYLALETRSAGSYAKCVLSSVSPVSYLNTVMAALKLFTGKSAGEALKELGAWGAARIIVRTLANLGVHSSVAGIAAELAIALVTCVGS